MVLKIKIHSMYWFMFAFLCLACEKESVEVKIPTPVVDTKADIHYLALGDSYTVGESVKYKESFPIQLESKLEGDSKNKVATEIIAVTGWRTDNLLEALKLGTNRSTYDFVTLLIGVNNQYQGRSIYQYEKEFAELLTLAIDLANDRPERVIVISIPDYAYTPFAQNRDREKISNEIDSYNNFAKSFSAENKVKFINITDITRKGLDELELVARDGLHPSGEAYKQFVDRIFPIISSALKD